MTRFPRCIPLLRLTAPSETRSRQIDVENLITTLRQHPDFKAQWFGPAALFGEAIYSDVAERIRDGIDAVMIAGWSGAVPEACPPELDKREREWALNSPFNNGADNLFGTGAFPLLGAEGWIADHEKELAVLRGNGMTIPVIRTRGAKLGRGGLRALVPRQLRRADRIAVLMDVDDPLTPLWIEDLARRCRGKTELLPPATDDGISVHPSVESFLSFPPHPIGDTVPRTNREKGKTLKAFSGWFPVDETRITARKGHPEWFSDMPGRAVLEDGMGLVFDAGVLVDLRVNGRSMETKRPARSYRSAQGVRVEWPGTGAASFEREDARGLRQLLEVEGRPASLEYTFSDEDAGVLVRLDWDPRVLEQFDWVDELVPWELPLFRASSPMALRAAHGLAGTIDPRPGVYRVPGRETTLSLGEVSASFFFKGARELPHPGIAVKVEESSEGLCYLVNPFGWYAPIRGEDAARLPAQAEVRFTLSLRSQSPH